MPRGKAVLSRRIFKGRPFWGMDCPEGFATYGLTPKALEGVQRMIEKYNNGDHFWPFVPIHKCPRVLRLKNENPT